MKSFKSFFEDYNKDLKTLHNQILKTESDLQTLLRSSNGSKDKAFNIIKASADHYNIILTNEMFDELCSIVNDNLEVEWPKE